MNIVSALTLLDGLSENQFVLHGSPNQWELLIPQPPDQGHLISEYNRLAVYGTCVVEIAILYAVIRAPSSDWGWRLVEDSWHPHILVVGPGRLPVSSGYVHIAKRSAFADFVLEGLTCLAYTPVSIERTILIYPHILELLIDQRRIVVMDYEAYHKASKQTATPRDT